MSVIASDNCGRPGAAGPDSAAVALVLQGANAATDADVAATVRSAMPRIVNSALSEHRIELRGAETPETVAAVADAIATVCTTRRSPDETQVRLGKLCARVPDFEGTRVITDRWLAVTTSDEQRVAGATGIISRGQVDAGILRRMPAMAVVNSGIRWRLRRTATDPLAIDVVRGLRSRSALPAAVRIALEEFSLTPFGELLDDLDRLFCQVPRTDDLLTHMRRDPGGVSGSARVLRELDGDLMRIAAGIAGDVAPSQTSFSDLVATARRLHR